MNIKLITVPPFESGWWWGTEGVVDMPPTAISMISSVLDKEGIEHEVYYPDLEDKDLIQRMRDMNVAEVGLFDHNQYEMRGSWTDRYLHNEWMKYRVNKSLDENDNHNFSKIFRAWLMNIVQRLDGAHTVMMSVYDTNALTTWWVSRKLKQRNPKVKIIWGGFNNWVLFNLLYRDLKSKRYSYITPQMKEHFRKDLKECVDIICFGEVDLQVPKIMRGEAAENCYSPHQLESMTVPPRFLQEDVRKLPPFTFDHFIPSVKSKFQVLTTYLARGCPYQCTFCDAKDTSNRYRIRDVAPLVDEMEVNASKFGIKRFVFSDGTINAAKGIGLKRLLRELMSRKLDFQISSQATLTDWDEETAQLCKDSGIVKHLLIGVESSDEKIRTVDMLKTKDLTQEKVIQKLKWFKESGVQIGSFWMSGFPGEVDINRDFLSKVGPYLTGAFICVFNLGWLNDNSYGSTDWYIEDVEIFKEATVQDFYRWSWVFCDLPGINVGFKYKVGRKEIQQRVLDLAGELGRHGVQCNV